MTTMIMMMAGDSGVVVDIGAEDYDYNDDDHSGDNYDVDEVDGGDNDDYNDDDDTDDDYDYNDDVDGQQWLSSWHS